MNTLIMRYEGLNSLTYFNIAEIQFLCRDMKLIIAHFTLKHYGKFLLDDQFTAFSDLEITFKTSSLKMPYTGSSFSASKLLSTTRGKNGYSISFSPPNIGQPVCLAKTNDDISKAMIYLDETIVKIRTQNLSEIFFRHFIQILLVCYLLKREGAILHSSGVILNDQGYLFAGRSGSGKSTLTRLLTTSDRFHPLSDERIIVRKISDGFNIYGTPWPSDAGIAENKKAPLAGIFFIGHGATNSIKALSPRNALNRLLQVILIPWDDSEGVYQMLGFCEELLTSVPAYELKFQPKADIAGFIENFISKE